MTAQNRSTLTALFEDGDTPSGDNFSDLLDSFVALLDTTAQSLSSNLQAPTLIATTEVNTPSLVVTDVSASSLRAETALIQVLSASSVFLNRTTITTLVCAMGTAAASAGGGEATPASVAGYITVQVSGRTVAIPYFEV